MSNSYSSENTIPEKTINGINCRSQRIVWDIKTGKCTPSYTPKPWKTSVSMIRTRN